VLDPDTDEELGPNQDGVLAIKGPTMMLGYLGVDPATTFDDQGFYRTGDIGHYDESGQLHYAGRRSEMIKTSGANVSPAEVEVQLRAMSQIKVARIVGVPDARRDEAVVACITPVAGSDLTAEEVTEFLRERIAAYKVPKHVLFFADGEIPMTSAGSKVRDAQLVALATERLALEPAPTPGAP
jgi:acyl-CoA synthetase (AMP-forming)/AMP-acid ligase II